MAKEKMFTDVSYYKAEANKVYQQKWDKMAAMVEGFRTTLNEFFTEMGALNQQLKEIEDKIKAIKKPDTTAPSQ